MNSISLEKTSYNEVPYPSFVFPQTSPDRLATLARLRGVNAVDPNASRMLELGCGDGTNLLAFAHAYPNSRFVGIDLAERHIEDAVASAKELGLKNIEFIAADLCRIDLAKLGKFDFIVAHGLFSWIPDKVREAVLHIYKECLTENGVGYISYNAYPGCHIREMINGMMQFHIEGIEDPIDKVSEARRFLEFLSDSVPDGSNYCETLRTEFEQIKSRSDSNIYHDDLAELNQPFYFHEFISMMDDSELSYIGEANPSTANPDKIKPGVRESIFEISDDPLVREQYIDFLEKRRFRASLVCRTKAEPLSEYDPAAIRDLRITSTLNPLGNNEVKTTDGPRFEGPNGGLDINHPLTKTMLLVLSERGLTGMRYSELIKEAANRIDTDLTESEIEQSEAFLIRMFRAEFIHLHSCEPKFTTIISEKPLASAFARRQTAKGSNFITTLAEANLNIENVFIAETLKLCDGTRNKNEIAYDLKERLNVPTDEMENFAKALPQMIEETLTEFAATGLLVS